MRIAFLQDHLRNGGTENQTVHLANGLAANGFDVHLIVFREGGVLDRKARDSAFTLHFLKQGCLKSDWFAPGLNALLRSLEVDALIAMGRMGNCHAGLRCKRSRSYKIIATFRTGKSIPWLQRRALQRADRLIANSREALQRIARDYGIERPDSVVIYNGCIRETETRPTSRVPSETQPPIHLVSASMFRPEKKQSRLLEICVRLPPAIDWHLTLAGDGPEREACIEEAERLGLSDRVSFPGLLADPSELYRQSDIAIHASSKESLPNFLVEAQMARLPVVAYDVGGVGETFAPDQSGFLIGHGNAAQFLEKLTELIESPDLRLRMSEAGSEYARANFTPSGQLQRYVELLRNLKAEAEG
ncbi:MAG: hypothetical protein CBD18_06710 [Opitutales bacterium TMED158]|nr:MAG: hypothetical protein CBD18_06710 [Opitutales bacterium TMED158]